MYATIGATAITTFPVATNQAILAIVPKPEVDPDFLALQIRYRAGELSKLNIQSTQKNVSKGILQQFPIYVPPISEQRAIVAILRTVLRTQEACEQVIAATRALKQSLVRHFFAPGFGSHASLNSWGGAKLGSLIVDGPQNGLYKPQSEYGDDTPIVRIDDFPNEGGIVTTAARRVTLTETERATYCLRVGDLLINRVNSLSHLGKTALIGQLREEVVFESNMMRLAIDSGKALPEFVFRYLCSPEPRNLLRSIAKRAVAQSSINQGDVVSLMVPLPPLPEQRSVIGDLSAVDGKLSEEIARFRALDRLFQSLLHHLMTGTLRVDHLVDQLDPEATA